MVQQHGEHNLRKKEPMGRQIWRPSYRDTRDYVEVATGANRKDEDVDIIPTF